MKLATLRDGARDGRLVVVSRDITRCSDAGRVSPTLQYALDRWEGAAPHLDLIARGIESGGQPTMRFHERDATPFLAFGDLVRIEMRDARGRSVFGAIEQTVERAEASA